MPGKYKTGHGEYQSDDFEQTETLIGRNTVPLSPGRKKQRPTSASKKKSNRPGTPGKRKRAQSAPLARTGRELWLNAVKNRQTALAKKVKKKVGLANNRRPQSPRHKTASEFWMDTLRKTGHGISTESTGMNTFSGKRPRDKDMPYLSTSSYMRQMAGTEKPAKMSDPTVRASPGTPAYKSQEEYYEQILEYKKQTSNVNQECSTLKAKVRRLEEDNLKKEKEIDSLLHPQKSEELRRTLADKRPDSSSMIHSLKQKILKLETQMRDKETAYVKLQGDLKTTKVDEMRQQMEVFYQEIVRLQHSKDTGMDKSVRTPGRDGTVKVKALNETIIRLNKSNEQLLSENRSLKEDGRNTLDDNKTADRRSPRVGDKGYVIPGGKRDYQDMNKKELLRTITQLERRVERGDRRAETSSIISYDSKASAVPGKIVLEGSLEARLDQLDKRESELLDQLDKSKVTMKQVRDERTRWKRRCEELERQLSGHANYEYATDARVERSRGMSPRGSRPSSGRAVSRASERPHSARSADGRPLSGRATVGDRPLSGRTERPLSGKERRERPSSAKRKTSGEMSTGNRQRLQDFKENRSAKVIQKNWRSHQTDKRNEWDRAKTEKVEKFKRERAAKKIQQRWTGFQHRKYEGEKDDASDLIRSAMLGHQDQRQRMSRYNDLSDDETEDENYNDCVNLIQSSVRGHQSRRTRMREHHFSSTGEDDDDDDDIMSPKHSSSASSHRAVRPQSPALYRGRPQSGISKSSRSSLGSSSKMSLSSMPRNTAYPRQSAPSSHMYDIADDDDF